MESRYRPSHPEVGVLIDAPAAQIPTIANDLYMDGIRASFALTQPAPLQHTLVVAYGDQAVPSHIGWVRMTVNQDIYLAWTGAAGTRSTSSS